MRRSRGVGTWGPVTPPPPPRMEKQKAINFLRNTGLAQIYRCRVINGPLAMLPFWLLGIGFIGTLERIPFPF